MSSWVFLFLRFQSFFHHLCPTYTNPWYLFIQSTGHSISQSISWLSPSIPPPPPFIELLIYAVLIRTSFALFALVFNAICECATILISTAVRIALVAIYLSIRNISSILVWFVVLVHFWPNSSAAILLRLLRNYNYYSFSDVYEYCWVAVAVLLLLLLLALIAIGSAIGRHTSKWAVIDIGQHIRGSLAIRTVIILLHYCGQSRSWFLP